ncbi:hypothetical protein GGR52DRAFT_294494 [Hypoxylon sp. FL1284]|nr:hypothetical protein GGR52DRAFT_294494 [Hypoxylon sp. FL1284]
MLFFSSLSVLTYYRVLFLTMTFFSPEGGSIPQRRSVVFVLLRIISGLVLLIFFFLSRMTRIFNRPNPFGVGC